MAPRAAWAWPSPGNTSRAAHVVATVRGQRHKSLHGLQPAFAGRLEIEDLGITAPSRHQALYHRLDGRSLDLLFTVAGAAIGPDDTPATVSDEDFARLMATNALGPMRVTEALGDLVAPTGTIAVMSSGQGSVANNTNGGFEIYRASKSALNQLLRSYAARHRDDPRPLLLLAPGWVKAALSGPNARLTIEESIPKPVGTIEAQRGRPGLQYPGFLGWTVPW